MSAARKHNEVNERVINAHERKTLKEEQQRLINMQNRNKPKRIKFRNVPQLDHSFDAYGFA